MTTEPIFDQRLKLVEESIDRHGSYLQSFLLTLTGNLHDAEELFDDLWIHVLHRFELDKISSLGLLRSKARQLFIDWYRKRKRIRSMETTLETLPEEMAPAHQFLEPSTEEEEQDFQDRFFAEYDVDLTPDQKRALVYHCRHGFTFKEIGKLMNRPSSTIGDWIQHSRNVFAEYLNKS